MRNVELLMPAGNLEKLEYAVRYGADAVYLGVVDFSLRAMRKGEIITLENLKRAIDLAHKLGAKAYLTLNIFAFNEDIKHLEESMDIIKDANPDAVLVSDFGILRLVKKYLPDMEAIYSEDDLTNVTTKFIMGEFVREKILELTHDEIPHTVTCYVENYEEDEKTVHIQVLVVVDRDNIKKIIIGKNGQMLKEIGTRARLDMEKFLGKKVFLETYVKTLKNWRDQEKYFLELGLKEEDI